MAVPPTLPPPRPVAGSPTRSLGAISGIDDEEDEGLIEMHNLADHQTMSVATSEDSFGDDRWRSNNNHPSLRNVSSDYEYNYLDEDVYVGRGFSFLIPSGTVRWFIGTFLLASVLIVFVPRQKETQDNPVVRKYKGAPQYVCPVDPIVPTAAHAFRGYQNTTDLMVSITDNFTEYRDTFRTSEYQNWGKTYNEVKESVRDWVVTRYLPDLKTGDSIFESGCGIGLNLLMILEILQDNDVRDLHLYGSTFEAALYANQVVEGILTESEVVGTGKRGVICTANSIDLGFVPDNSFDLVFSGHISPELDVWVSPTEKSIDTLAMRNEVCAAKQTDWKSAALVDLAQTKQKEWYRQWVAEMIRIAKPGAPVIVQNNLMAYCSAPVADPLGAGVPPAFWRESAETYGWDVDPDSIAVDSDSLFPNHQRYHVFMKKTEPV